MAKIFIINPPTGRWTPNLLGIKLLGWYDASRSETITLVAGAVSQWNDLSGRNNHWIQTTAEKRPSYSTTFPGRPSVIFDGANDSLLTTNVLPQNIAIFAVFGYPNNNSQPPFAWSRNDGNNASNCQELHLQMNGSIRAVNNEGGPYADTPTGTPQSFYDNAIIGGAYGESGNNVTRAHLNGRAVQALTLRQDNITSVLCLGQRDNNLFASASRFTEIAIFTNWTIPDIQRIEGYFAHRWQGLLLSRLIADHPFKNRLPLVTDI
jgi:hypothetical protein